MDYLFLILLVLVSFLFSVAGQGGASGLLALMAIFGMEHLLMRTSALTLNLFVAGISFIVFYRRGYMKWRLILPLLVTSAPMAYLGAQTQINHGLYQIILGILLLISMVSLLYKPEEHEKIRNDQLIPSLFIGALLGFISGMIGIGGGILLSPLILLLRWANRRQAAAASILFILLNSAAGLYGIYQAGITPNPQIYIWVAFAFGGGLLGGWIKSLRFSKLRVQYILAFVLLIASVKLFLT
jgi:uncharacterized protein